MRWYNFTTKTANWVKEFGQEYDVPREVLELVGKGLAEDYSTRHEQSPSFGTDKTDEEGNVRQVRMWVNHPDPAMREDPDDRRFVVLNEENDVLANTDDVNEAVRAYLDAIGEKPQAQTVTLESIQERMYDLTRKPGGMTPKEVSEMKELRQRHKELHPEKKELPKFMASRRGTEK